MIDIVSTHILSMRASISLFEKACLEDALRDKTISPKERRQLQKIKRANTRYLRALSKVK